VINWAGLCLISGMKPLTHLGQHVLRGSFEEADIDHHSSVDLRTDQEPAFTIKYRRVIFTEDQWGASVHSRVTKYRSYHSFYVHVYCFYYLLLFLVYDYSFYHLLIFLFLLSDFVHLEKRYRSLNHYYYYYFNVFFVILTYMFIVFIICIVLFYVCLLFVLFVIVLCYLYVYCFAPFTSSNYLYVQRTCAIIDSD